MAALLIVRGSGDAPANSESREHVSGERRECVLPLHHSDGIMTQPPFALTLSVRDALHSPVLSRVVQDMAAMPSERTVVLTSGSHYASPQVLTSGSQVLIDRSHYASPQVLTDGTSGYA